MARLVRYRYGHRIAVNPDINHDPFAICDPETGVWQMKAGGQIREFVSEVSDRIEQVVASRRFKVSKTIDSSAVEAERERFNGVNKGLLGMASHYKNASGRRAVATILMDDQKLRHPTAEWETLLDELAFNDGTKINLATGRRTNIKPEDRILLTANCPAPKAADIRNAEDSLPVQVIREIFADREDLLPFYRRALYYTLGGRRDEKTWHFIRGKGDTGKNTLMAMMWAAMGGYAAMMAFSAIEHVDGPGAPFTMGKYPNKRYVWMDETPPNKKIDSLKIKTWTGGAEVRGENKYETAFFFQPRLALWITSNYAINLYNDDGAMWNRERLFILERVFSLAEQKPGYKMAQTWVPHAKTLIAWILGAREDYWTNRLAQMPQRMKEDLLLDRDDSDWFGRFLRLYCATQEGLSIPLRELVVKLNEWRVDAGYRKMNYDTVKKLLRDKDYKITREERVVNLDLNYEALAAETV